MVHCFKNFDEEINKTTMSGCNCRSNLLNIPKDKQLRFGIGAKVMANVGEFTPGIILAQWDEGNAYRIELLDDAKTNVWAPVDHDTFVRARSSGDDKRAQLLNTSDS